MSGFDELEENALREETEAGLDKCLGQDGCKKCPRYLDDCDGLEKKCSRCKKMFEPDEMSGNLCFRCEELESDAQEMRSELRKRVKHD
jgi:hypothetical protein